MMRSWSVRAAQGDFGWPFVCWLELAGRSTGLTYYAQYDVLTRGAGYLDLAAAVNAAGSISVPAGTAMSPLVQFDPTTNDAYLVADQTALWGRTALWGKESVYGSNAFVEGSTALWGRDTLDGSTALWGRDALWGSDDPEGFTALWGRDALWSTGTPEAASVLWGSSDVQGSTALWGAHTPDGTSVLWGSAVPMEH